MQHRTMGHVEQLRTRSQHRGKATAREPRVRGSTEGRKQQKCDERRAQTSSKPVSYTRAAKATTNNENGNEVRRTALIMKPTSNQGKRRRANPVDEAQRKQQKSHIRKQKQQARLVHIH